MSELTRLASIERSARQVALELEEIAALLEFAAASRFKVHAYSRAAEVVNTLGDELGAVVEQGRMRDFEGIGPTLSQQIEDMWKTGHSEYLERLRREQPPGVAELVQVQGLTSPRAAARPTGALALPLFKIWGHALGRILNHRPPIECDVRALLDTLATSRGAVEVNADPHRLDLPPAWIPAARERGIPIVISVDAHSTRGRGALTSCATASAWRAVAGFASGRS